HSVGKIHLRQFGAPKGVPLDDLDPSEYPECGQMWGERRIDTVPTPYYGLQSVELSIGHGSWVQGDYMRWLEQQDPDAPALTTPQAGEPLASGAEQSWKMALPEELHYSKWIADRTIAYLERAAESDEPFFLWCSFPDPHHPFCPPHPWCDMYDPASIPLPNRTDGELANLPPHYARIVDEAFPLAGRFQPTRMTDDQIRDIWAMTYGLISLTDHHLGRVLDALDSLGLRENTCTSFFSDHGDMLGDHWIVNKGPFHMDSLVRVPFIWSWPGHFDGGEETDALASMLDFAPTVLDLAGVPIPEGDVPLAPETENQLPPWPGHSLTPILSGQASAVQQSVLIENDEDYLGLRLRTLVTDRYKITAYPGQPYGELFDLQSDPSEQHNLWDAPAHAATKSALLIQLLEKLTETDTVLPRRMCHA
ncbi:MAG TPA: sulfatase-like hydrolase/transferase, partial [Armatimonadota bacterium]|nr:sulfatase-like hydrolase/transferase [Armatimonadota bacterium]